MKKPTRNEMFSVLSHHKRMKIIEVLFDGESSVNNIVEKTDIEQTLVSHHLRKLRNYKIVNSRVAGKQRIYSLNQKTMVELLIIIDEHISLFGDDE